MRFGCFVPQGWRLDLVGVAPGSQWSAIVASARSIEAAGFESLWVNDHFHTVPVPTQEPTFEAWSVMSALAVATDTVRLGQMCTCVSYRPPAYLAKMAATIDVVAGGRLEMGIGAGWYEHEYTGYGYEFPAPATRISMLDEAVEIMRRMWTEDTVNFEGRHYRLKGAINRPRPAAGPAHSDLDRRRRGAADPARGGAPRQLHELRREHRCFRAQVGDLARPLRRRGQGFLGHRAIDELPRRVR